MNLGIDLDGVVCDFATKANEWLADELEVERIAIDRWDWYESYGPEGKFAWDLLWNVEVPKGFFRRMAPVYGAHSGLSRLRRGGHTLVFCTARPMAAAADTETWLEDFGFGDCPLFVTASAEAKRHLGVDLLLDDRPDTVQAHAGGVLYRQPWNREAWLSTGNSVRSWDQFVGMVEAMSD